eukprot:TRINITY_DN11601_c0_g1_i1.p2 TRINITY_DN11601_c0_g1~~TRINITY_DN11601_c0_g1_i1.p2  ORF type:complete len:252 (+),score=82.30 TRINITY_DN11601_c0_g1_i1:153-908(+)
MAASREGALLCFDLDDTLWAVGPAISGAEEGTVDWLQERFEPGHIEHFVCKTRYKALVKEVFQKHTDLAKRCDLVELRRNIIREGLSRGGASEGCIDEHTGGAVDTFCRLRSTCTDLFDHGDRVLAELSKDHTLAALTNGTACLKAARVAPYFSHHISPMHDGMAPKPHPVMFESVLAHFGAEPHEAIMIGDDPVNDIMPALSVGMDAIWVNVLGNKEFDDRPSEVPCVTSLDQLPGAVADILSKRGSLAA